MFKFSLREVVFSDTSAALSALPEGVGQVEISPWLLCVQAFLLLSGVFSSILSSEDSFESIRIVNEFRDLDLEVRSDNLRGLLLFFSFSFSFSLLIAILITVVIINPV